MVAKARARREREESRVADLRASIRDVELRVVEESERHIEAARSLQAWAETQVGSVRVRLEEALAAKHADTLQRVAARASSVSSKLRGVASATAAVPRAAAAAARAPSGTSDKPSASAAMSAFE